MKKTLILMLLCGVASADMFVPDECNNMHLIDVTPKGSELCEELKEACIDKLERGRISFNNSSVEYQQYETLLKKVTAIDCNKNFKGTK